MPIGDLLAQITGEPSPTQSTYNIPPAPKRKAEDQVRKPVDKIQKTSPALVTSSKPVNSSKASSIDPSMSRGKPPTTKNVAAQNSGGAAFKNGQPTPPPSSEPAKPPKKGSFAEIMARAKAQQATAGQIGKIQHKRIEKLPSKREREEMKAQRAQNIGKNLMPGSKFGKMGHSTAKEGQNSSRENDSKKTNGSKEPVVEKKVKKAALATTGYAGTARPKPSNVARGPSRPSASTISSRYDRGSDRYGDNRHGSSKRYTYASEEEEDEEDEEDYESDASSDMEAAVFEVDEEEEMAARIARREDAEALAEENKHKREKEEKRRRLAALAKARR